MGRHSAPGDDGEVDTPVVAAAEPGAALRGRHTRTEDVEDTGPVPGNELRSLEARASAQDEQPTQRIPLQDFPLQEIPLQDIPFQDIGPSTTPTSEEQPKPKSKAKGKERPKVKERPKGKDEPKGRGNQSTAADLALLRRRADVRNRVLGAVLVPFVLYAAVMVVLGASGVQYVLWVWIPLVSAGILAGLILDAAHRERPPEEPEPGAGGGGGGG